MDLKLEQLLDKAIETQLQIDSVKDLYKEMDAIIDKLISSGFETLSYKGRVISLIDNFKNKNTCFRVAGIKRFELKIE